MLAAYAATGPSLGVLYPFIAVAGAGIGPLAVLWATAPAQRIPPHLLSRVSAWDWMGSPAQLPVGYILAGWPAHLIGGNRLLEIDGTIGSIALVLVLAPDSTRHLRRIEPGASTVDLAPESPVTATAPGCVEAGAGPLRG